MWLLEQSVLCERTLENLAVAQLAKTFPDFYKIIGFVTLPLDHRSQMNLAYTVISYFFKHLRHSCNYIYYLL
jgi:hypothetical protein